MILGTWLVPTGMYHSPGSVYCTLVRPLNTAKHSKTWQNIAKQSKTQRLAKLNMRLGHTKYCTNSDGVNALSPNGSPHDSLTRNSYGEFGCSPGIMQSGFARKSGPGMAHLSTMSHGPLPVIKPTGTKRYSTCHARKAQSPVLLPGKKVMTIPVYPAGVKTEKIRKERILAGLRDIWRVCLEILPLHKSVEKRRKTVDI